MRDRSVIVADNVICPGAPEYLEYVRSGKGNGRGKGRKVKYSSREVESHMPNGWMVRALHCSFGVSHLMVYIRTHWMLRQSLLASSRPVDGYFWVGFITLLAINFSK